MRKSSVSENDLEDYDETVYEVGFGNGFYCYFV